MKKTGRFISVHIVLGIVLAVALIAADQVTKFLAVIFLKGNNSYVLIDGVLELKYLENSGAAFGIFQNKQWAFYIITGIIVCLIIFFWTVIFSKLKNYCSFCDENPSVYSSKTYNDMIALSYILMALFAGAIGNLIDRVINKYVVDFIYFSFINFPVFNFADILVTVSAIMMVVFFIFIFKDDENFALLGKRKK